MTLLWFEPGATRITGGSFSLLGFGGGLQLCDPGPAQREIVRRFLVALEDRRVLYNPMQLEVRSQVDYSVHQIRQACTETLVNGGLILPIPWSAPLGVDDVRRRI